jgi:hypothetical protein
MASKKLPEYLCRGDVCALTGLDSDALDQYLKTHFGAFRRDGTMKLTTARKVADQLALEKLRENRALQFHPCQHEGHDVTKTVIGPYCRECMTPLFDWPESRALVQDAPPEYLREVKRSK